MFGNIWLSITNYCKCRMLCLQLSIHFFLYLNCMGSDHLVINKSNYCNHGLSFLRNGLKMIIIIDDHNETPFMGVVAHARWLYLKLIKILVVATLLWTLAVPPNSFGHPKQTNLTTSTLVIPRLIPLFMIFQW